MPFDRRPSGLPAVSELPWGSHFCHFHQTKQDLLEVLVPYFKAGLRNNELCVWETSGSLGVEDARKALSKAVPDLPALIRKGQLFILPARRRSPKNGAADRAMFQRLDEAASMGFEGLRFAAQAVARKAGARTFVCPGTAALESRNAVAAFSYPRGAFDAAGLMEVVGKHRFALLKDSGTWKAVEGSAAWTAKDDLRRTEEKLQSLFDHMSEGFALHRIVLDSKGRPCDYVFLEVNPAFEKLTGLRAGAVLGRKVSEVIPGIRKDPADWVGRYGKVALTGRPARFESRSEELGKWFSVSAFCPNKGYFAVTFTDITDRKAAEEALNAARDRAILLARFPEENPNPVLRVSLEGTVLYHNPAAAASTGWACRTGRRLPKPLLPLLKETATSGTETSHEVLLGERHYLVTIKFFPREAYANMYGRDITGRKAAEKALAHSEERYRGIVENASEGIVTGSLDGTITYANQRWAAMLGYSRDELIGRMGIEFIDPGHKPAVVQAHTKLKAGSSFSGEFKFRRKDGSSLWTWTNSVPLRGRDGAHIGNLGMHTDITERKTAEEALAHSEARVRLKLESLLSPKGDIGALELSDIIDAPALQKTVESFHAISPVPMAIIDTKGKVLVGVGWQDICVQYHRVHPETCRNCVESDTQLSAGVPPGEYRLYKCKNGMWDVATPIMIGGRHMGNVFSGQFFFKDEKPDRESFRRQARRHGFPEDAYLAALDRVPRLSRQELEAAMGFFLKLAHDISQLSWSNIQLVRETSERKAAEEALQKAHDELERRVQERTKMLQATLADLKRSNAELEQFAYVASHDLQEPLRMVGSFTQLLARRYKGKLDQQADEFISFAVDGAVRMRSLIDDLLEYSRVGRLVPTHEDVDCNAALAATLSHLRLALDEAGAKVDSGPLPTLVTDRTQLERVFQNLIVNAVKFRKFDVPPRIRVEAREIPEGWRFSVSDNGVGIEPGQLERVFRIFQRARRPDAPAGTGLGLAICRRIIERAGGRIWAQSAPGKGSTFHFTLPLRPVPIPAAD
ncbi:MAG: PocR ligand-binding domain-containing protein [Elusimicrobiota bacterium]|jgi:PAS domain S-box-containing protein